MCSPLLQSSRCLSTLLRHPQQIACDNWGATASTVTIVDCGAQCTNTMLHSQCTSYVCFSYDPQSTCAAHNSRGAAAYIAIAICYKVWCTNTTSHSWWMTCATSRNTSPTTSDHHCATACARLFIDCEVQCTGTVLRSWCMSCTCSSRDPCPTQTDSLVDICRRWSRLLSKMKLRVCASFIKLAPALNCGKQELRAVANVSSNVTIWHMNSTVLCWRYNELFISYI